MLCLMRSANVDDLWGIPNRARLWLQMTNMFVNCHRFRHVFVKCAKYWKNNHITYTDSYLHFTEAIAVKKFQT